MSRDIHQADAIELTDALVELMDHLVPHYEQYNVSPDAVANRTYIAATRELVGHLNWWIRSNTTTMQEVLPFDKDEMIRRLDQTTRTLRHTR